MLHFVTSYMKQNKSRKQTLESAQYGLEISFKINPQLKNDISGYIWYRSFIQMVKCSLLDEKIVYQFLCCTGHV